MKPVKDEPKIIVELRPDQLASLVNAQCVADTVARQDKYAKLAAWMQHVQEESE